MATQRLRDLRAHVRVELAARAWTALVCRVDRASPTPPHAPVRDRMGWSELDGWMETERAGHHQPAGGPGRNERASATDGFASLCPS
jgi:hypothetical protein